MSDVSILIKLTVDANTRKITIPNNGTIFGVVGDIEINRVMFSIPRYYSGFDMSDFVARVNYVNPNGEINFYDSSDMAETEETVTFTWLMGSDVTKYAGDVKFSIKLYKVSGNTYVKSFNTTTGVGKVLEGLDVEKQITPEQQTTLLGKLEADIKMSIDGYVNNQVKKNVDDYINKAIKTKVGDAGGTISPSEVKKIVDEYLKENPESFLPENIVLVEESDNEIMTADAIMGEILDKMELKTVNDQTLGLYIGTKLISSVRLEEFKTLEIICTGITLAPSNTTAYGKTTIEVIATATPQDCTQKIRWFTTDADLATVSDGTVITTGKKGEVTIYAICGNYRAECKVVITAYVYPEFNFQINQILETVGAAYSRTEDSAEMRISSDYIQTPVDTVITLTAGVKYLYQLYKYKDDKLDSFTSWISCAGTIKIASEEFSGFAIKIRKNNYGKWTSDDITTFTKTVTIESA